MAVRRSLYQQLVTKCIRLTPFGVCEGLSIPNPASVCGAPYPRRLSAITAVRLPALPIAYEQTISHLLSSQDLARSFIHSCCASWRAASRKPAACAMGCFAVFARLCGG